jgi:phosphate:Na+ symporter
LFQSSSITTGLCILLVQQNIVTATAAIPIVIGANIGTSATALVASIKMQRTARRVAIANLCFNVFGVLLFLPFLGWSARRIVELAGAPAQAVAWTQLIFNVGMSMAVLILLRFLQGWLERFEAKGAIIPTIRTGRGIPFVACGYGGSNVRLPRQQGRSHPAGPM